jgi:hypothetical protein
LTGSLAAIGQWVDDMDLDMDSDEDEREEKERSWEKDKEKEKGRDSEKDKGHGDGGGNTRMNARVGGNGDPREEERTRGERVLGGKRGDSKGGDLRRGFELSDTDGEMDGTETYYRGDDREWERGKKRNGDGDREKERERDRVTAPCINSSARRASSFSDSPFKILTKDAIMLMVRVRTSHITYRILFTLIHF